MDNHYSDYEKALEQGIDAQLFAKPIDLFCDKNITNALGNVYKQNIPMWQNNSNGLNFMEMCIRDRLYKNQMKN